MLIREGTLEKYNYHSPICNQIIQPLKIKLLSKSALYCKWPQYTHDVCCWFHSLITCHNSRFRAGVIWERRRNIIDGREVTQLIFLDIWIRIPGFFSRFSPSQWTLKKPYSIFFPLHFLYHLALFYFDFPFFPSTLSILFPFISIFQPSI